MAQLDDFAQDTSTSGQIGVGTLAKGSFESNKDADWFAIDLLAGTRYLFALQQDGSAYYYHAHGLKVFSADGQAVSESVFGVQQHAPALEFAPTVSGRYYVAAVSGQAGWALGKYILSASIRQAGDDYSADSRTSALFVPGGTTSGTFEVAGDQDWIKFHAEPNVHYSFSVQGTQPGSMILVDAAGNEAGPAWSFGPVKAGDYYLKLHGLQAGSYTITAKTWADDYSGDTVSMGLVAPGGNITGKLEYASDVDRIQLSGLEAGKFYTVSLTADPDYYSMTVLAANGDTIDYRSGDPTIGLPLTFQAKDSGDAYITLSADLRTNPRTDALNYVVSVSAGTADDIGDTQATAKQTSGTSSGSLQFRTDVDMFKIRLEAGVTYSVKLAGEGIGQGYQKVVITGADGATHTVSGAGLKYTTFTPSRSGDYYAAVGTDGGVTPNWAYKLSLAKSADDAGAAAATARKMVLGAPISGVLETGGGDRDWYAVTLVAGATYVFKAVSASATLTSGGQLRLLDGSGKELAVTASQYYNMLTETLSFKAAASGTYYVEMSSPVRNVGAYTLTASVGTADDHGGTAATATAIKPGAEVKGALEVGADKDVFKLDVVAGGVYAFKFSSPQLGLFNGVSLVDAAGKGIDRELSSGTPSDQYLFAAKATGSVYVTVSNGYNSSDQGGQTYTLSTIEYGIDDSGWNNQTSGSMAVGVPRQGRIDYPGDWDLVRVPLQAGKSYVFSLLDSKTGGGSATFPSTVSTWSPPLEVVDASGRSVGVLRSDAKEMRVSYTATSTGDYFVRVHSDNFRMGSYTLKSVQLTGDVSGPALVASSHADGAANLALTGNMFKLTFSEAVSIDASLVRVLDSAGKPLAFSNYYGTWSPSATDNALEFRLLKFLAPGSSYTLELPRGAVHDLAGNAHSGPQLIKFTTAPLSAAPTAGDDLLAGSNGGTIDGGAGIDSVLYNFDGIYPTVTRAGDKVEVKYYANGAQKTDTLLHVERVLFDRSALALDVDGNGGQAYRLYRAAFHRQPDQDGLGFWIAQMDKGLALDTVAQYFVSSAEFQSLYGAAQSNGAFINLMYSNVLGRTPDAGGFDFWDKAMSNGVTREQVLVHFSESAENVAALASLIGNGFNYTPF